MKFDITSIVLLVFIAVFIKYMFWQTYRIRDDAQEDGRQYRARLASYYNPKVVAPRSTRRPSLPMQARSIVMVPVDFVRQLYTLFHLTYKLHIAR